MAPKKASSRNWRAQKAAANASGSANAAPPLTQTSTFSDPSMVNAEQALKVKHDIQPEASPDIEMGDAEPLAERSDVNKLVISPFEPTKPSVATPVDTTSAIDTPMTDADTGETPDKNRRLVEHVISGRVMLRSEQGSELVESLFDDVELRKYVRSDADRRVGFAKQTARAIGFALCDKVRKLHWRPFLVARQLDSVMYSAYAAKLQELFHMIEGRRLTDTERDDRVDAAFRWYKNKALANKKKASYGKQKASAANKDAPGTEDPDAMEISATEGTSSAEKEACAPKKTFIPKTNASGLKMPTLTKQTASIFTNTSAVHETFATPKTTAAAKTSAAPKMSASNKAVSATTKTSAAPKMSTSNKTSTTSKKSSTLKAAATIKKVTPVTQPATSENQMTIPMRPR